MSKTSRGRLVISLIVLVSLPVVLFVLLEPHGWTGISYWQGVMESLDHPFLKAMAIISLMALDLVLPVPSIPLLLWSGNELGVVTGSMVNLFALTLAHTLAYEVCRGSGLKAYRRFIGKEVHQSASILFNRHGPTALVISRNIPILSEVFCALAGLTSMPRNRFQLSIIISNAPTAIFVAYLGQKGAGLMLIGVIFLMAFPLLLLMVLGARLRATETTPHIGIISDNDH